MNHTLIISTVSWFENRNNRARDTQGVVKRLVFLSTKVLIGLADKSHKTGTFFYEKNDMTCITC